MIYLTTKMPRNVGTVHTHTHTIDLVRKSKINISEKGNISLPCGYYDTG